MEALPITIKRSIIGYFLIALAGLAIILIITWAGYEGFITGVLTPDLANVVVFADLIIFIGLIITLYVYSLGKITLTQQGILATNWFTLFSTRTSVISWVDIESVDTNKPGVLAVVFDYGTLLIQTAGTQQNVSLTFVQAPDYWQSQIQARADAAPQIVHNV